MRIDKPHQVHYWRHDRIGNYLIESPLMIGRESSGIVEAYGSDIETLSVGDEVALEPGMWCSICEACRSGQSNLCESMHFAATPPYDGTLVTY